MNIRTFYREMCMSYVYVYVYVVDTRFLRSFGVMMEITTFKSSKALKWVLILLKSPLFTLLKR